MMNKRPDKKKLFKIKEKKENLQLKKENVLSMNFTTKIYHKIYHKHTTHYMDVNILATCCCAFPSNQQRILLKDILCKFD